MYISFLLLSHIVLLVWHLALDYVHLKGKKIGRSILWPIDWTVVLAFLFLSSFLIGDFVVIGRFGVPLKLRVTIHEIGFHAVFSFQEFIP